MNGTIINVNHMTLHVSNPVKTPVRIRNQNDQIRVRIYSFCSDCEQESKKIWDLAVK